MTWFRALFDGSRRLRGRSAFCPAVEAMEDRNLLNVSSVFDSAGRHYTCVVDTSNVMTMYTPTYVLQVAQDVLRAHLYRDINGNVGTLVVYNNFNAYDYDYAGAHFLGSNIVDVGKAYDKAGHIREDVTYSAGGGFTTFEYTSTSVGIVSVPGTVAVLIHPFQDASGNLGAEVSYFDTVTSCRLVEYDSTGAHFLANDAVADRSVDFIKGVPSDFILDVTYISNTAFEYTSKTARLLGDNIPI